MSLVYVCPSFPFQFTFTLGQMFGPLNHLKCRNLSHLPFNLFSTSPQIQQTPKSTTVIQHISKSMAVIACHHSMSLLNSTFKPPKKHISTFKLSYRILIYHPIPQFRRFSILYPCLPFPPRGRNGRADHLRGDHQRGQLDAQLGFVVDLQVVTQVVVPGESPV